jgi:hypothetical protein
MHERAMRTPEAPWLFPGLETGRPTPHISHGACRNSLCPPPAGSSALAALAYRIPALVLADLAVERRLSSARNGWSAPLTVGTRP